MVMSEQVLEYRLKKLEESITKLSKVVKLVVSFTPIDHNFKVDIIKDTEAIINMFTDVKE